MSVKHYKIYCETDAQWEDWYLPDDAAEPTTCPVDSGHSVTASSVSVVETIGPNEVSLKNEDGTLASFPMTDGKTPIFQPSVIPAGYYFYGTGHMDDISGGIIGEGEQLAFMTAGAAGDEVEITGRFLHHVYIIGGDLAIFSAEYDDWISMTMRAPASSPEDKTGTHDGNANKVSVGPFNVIVPAPGDDGDWNVDGATLEAGEINQGLCPVPAFDASGLPNGWWNWDPTESPSLTPNLTNEGAYNLFDAVITLGRQANRYPLTNGSVTPTAAIKGKKILPHWEWVFLAKRGATAGSLKMAARLDTARLKTI